MSAVKHFLVVFHRPTATLVRCEEFEDSKTALAERFFTERLLPIIEFRNFEVVVLSASTLDQVKLTHGRYFAGPSWMS